MTKREAEQLLSENDATVCLGYRRRRDGTIITDDCPVGLRRIRRGILFARRVAVSIVGLILTAAGARADDAPTATFNNTRPQSLPNGAQQKHPYGARFGWPTNHWSGAVPSTTEKDIFVRYDFRDQLNSPRPPGWTFLETCMPQPGTQFILFITKATSENGIYKTYNRSFGRMVASDVNLLAVQKELHLSHGSSVEGDAKFGGSSSQKKYK